ncbi:shikimate kinase [Cyanobacterium sp. uoEpiScrs1]|uniref:shikimate kinase n=1 Tax=Cyanobacterium sp. uoEpiScrs1 TaxID=2976343 RepID=UPI00226A8F6A|nr:shikimate kinase [Cyanobacterium sp. uoEpiScrs1]
MQGLLQGINVFLIGMMGTGKTTVGKLLAQELAYRFFDTDILIERVIQQPVDRIFISMGEANFRKIESQVLAEVTACTKSVIATGGGVILKPQNWVHLRHGLIIWLDASVELLTTRLADDKTRPLLQNTDLTSKLSSLLEQRRSLYNQGDLRITINKNDTPEMLLSKILENIPGKIRSNLEVSNN